MMALLPSPGNYAMPAERRPTHVRWTGHRGSSAWYADRWDAAELDARTRRYVAGQWEPLQRSPADSLFVGIRGNLEFSVDGAVHPLQPYDLLRVRADTPHRWVNLGPDDALLLEVAECSSPAGPLGPVAVHLPWAESSRRFALRSPLAEREGYRRFSGPFVDTDRLTSHLVRSPIAQGSPWHALPGDLLVLQLDGAVEFAAAGQTWRLTPLDLLFIPASVPYTYENVGSSEALFFDVFERPQPGDAAIYYERDPGWPVEADAPLLDTHES